MRRFLLLPTLLALWAIMPTTSQARVPSASSLLKSVTVHQTNGGNDLGLTPESYVRIQYRPNKGQFKIAIYLLSCPARPEVGYGADMEIIRHTPGSTAKHICYNFRNGKPLWFPWTDGVQKNPRGNAARRRWIKSVAGSTQRGILKGAGCTRRNKRGRFVVAHSKCPKMSLATSSYLSHTRGVLTWGCAGRKGTDYKRVIWHDPIPEPGQTVERWSKVTQCNGASIPQKLPPRVGPPLPPAPPAPVPAPVPPAPAPPAADPPPSVPSLTANGSGYGQILLSWSASTDNTAVDHYDIYRDGNKVNSVNHPTTTYTDNGLTDGVFYSYVVRAVDTAGNVSEPSNTATATPGSD